MPKVSNLQLQLVREEGFDEAFNQLLGDGFKQENAFKLLNALYRTTYGKNRYASYDSYQITRSERYKKNRN